MWRTGLGSLVLFALAAAKRQPLAMTRRQFSWSILAGFIFFLDLFVWHRSILFIGAGLATILGNTQVFGTAAIGRLVFKERLSPMFYLASSAALVGIILLVGPGEEVMSHDKYLSGIGYGLLTALAYACYLVTLRLSGLGKESTPALTFMAWTSFFSSIFLFLSAVIEGEPSMLPDLYGIFVLSLLAIIAQAIGWWAIFTGLPQLPASRAGLVLLLQPLLATVWGVWFFGEYLAPVQLLGAVVTLTAIYAGISRRLQTVATAEKRGE